jgi:hypothetical protein
MARPRGCMDFSVTRESPTFGRGAGWHRPGNRRVSAGASDSAWDRSLPEFGKGSCASPHPRSPRACRARRVARDGVRVDVALAQPERRHTPGRGAAHAHRDAHRRRLPRGRSADRVRQREQLLRLRRQLQPGQDHERRRQGDVLVHQRLRRHGPIQARPRGSRRRRRRSSSAAATSSRSPAGGRSSCAPRRPGSASCAEASG